MDFVSKPSDSVIRSNCFVPLYGPSLERYLKALRELQGALGKVSDYQAIQRVLASDPGDQKADRPHAQREGEGPSAALASLRFRRPAQTLAHLSGSGACAVPDQASGRRSEEKSPPASHQLGGDRRWTTPVRITPKGCRCGPKPVSPFAGRGRCSSAALTPVHRTMALQCNPGFLCCDSQLLASPIGSLVFWTFQSLGREHGVSKFVNTFAIFTRQPMPLGTSHAP